MSLDTSVPKDGMLRVAMRPELFLRLLFILAANSLDWIESARHRQISVQATQADARCIVHLF